MADYQTYEPSFNTEQFKQLIDMIQKNPQPFFDMINNMGNKDSSTGTDWSKFMMNSVAKRDDFLGKGMQAYQTYDYMKSPTFGKDMESLWGGIKDVGTGIGTAASTVGGWMQSLLGLFGI
jgi:hypothetical protein